MRWLVLCLLLISLPGLARAEPRLALIIANSAYTDDMPPLPNPVNDGKLIAATLQKLGFSVTLVSDVDQKGMKRAISQFGDALTVAGPKATALFYYAGHGMQVEGQNYLIPVHAAIQKEADVDLEAVSADTVLKQMEYAEPDTSIVILDACRNNPLSRSVRAGTRGLARMDAPNGSYVAYSTAPGEVAADGIGKNSPFATALAAEMVKPGQGIEDVFRNVRVNVSKATNGVQTPWDSSSLMNSFYFAREKPVVAAVAPTPTPAPASDAAPVSTAPSTFDAAELAFWDSIKNSVDASDYAAYIEQYPNGNFAKLAKSRQTKLQAEAATRASKATPPTSPTSLTTAPAAIIPEEEFESPLADGTIVLSEKVKAALDGYLDMDVASTGYKYFYVSLNGKQSGEAICEDSFKSTGRFPTCALKGGDGKVKNMLRKKALGECANEGPSECVLLFAGDSQSRAYKPLH